MSQKAYRNQHNRSAPPTSKEVLKQPNLRNNNNIKQRRGATGQGRSQQEEQIQPANNNRMLRLEQRKKNHQDGQGVQIVSGDRKKDHLVTQGQVNVPKLKVPVFQKLEDKDELYWCQAYVEYLTNIGYNFAVFEFQKGTLTVQNLKKTRGLTKLHTIWPIFELQQATTRETAFQALRSLYYKEFKKHKPEVRTVLSSEFDQFNTHSDFQQRKSSFKLYLMLLFLQPHMLEHFAAAVCNNLPITSKSQNVVNDRGLFLLFWLTLCKQRLNKIFHRQRAQTIKALPELLSSLPSTSFQEFYRTKTVILNAGKQDFMEYGSLSEQVSLMQLSDDYAQTMQTDLDWFMPYGTEQIEVLSKSRLGNKVTVIDIEKAKQELQLSFRQYYHGLYAHKKSNKGTRVFRTYKCLFLQERILMNGLKYTELLIRLNECLTSNATYCKVIQLVFKQEIALINKDHHIAMLQKRPFTATVKCIDVEQGPANHHEDCWQEVKKNELHIDGYYLVGYVKVDLETITPDHDACGIANETESHKQLYDSLLSKHSEPKPSIWGGEDKKNAESKAPEWIYHLNLLLGGPVYLSEQQFAVQHFGIHKQLYFKEPKLDYGSWKTGNSWGLQRAEPVDSKALFQMMSSDAVAHIIFSLSVRRTIALLCVYYDGSEHMIGNRLPVKTIPIRLVQNQFWQFAKRPNAYDPHEWLTLDSSNMFVKHLLEDGVPVHCKFLEFRQLKYANANIEEQGEVFNGIVQSFITNADSGNLSNNQKASINDSEEIERNQIPNIQTALEGFIIKETNDQNTAKNQLKAIVAAASPQSQNMAQTQGVPFELGPLQSPQILYKAQQDVDMEEGRLTSNNDAAMASNSVALVKQHPYNGDDQSEMNLPIEWTLTARWQPTCAKCSEVFMGQAKQCSLCLSWLCTNCELTMQCTCVLKNAGQFVKQEFNTNFIFECQEEHTVQVGKAFKDALATVVEMHLQASNNQILAQSWKGASADGSIKSARQLKQTTKLEAKQKKAAVQQSVSSNTSLVSKSFDNSFQGSKDVATKPHVVQLGDTVHEETKGGDQTKGEDKIKDKTMFGTMEMD